MNSTVNVKQILIEKWCPKALRFSEFERESFKHEVYFSAKKKCSIYTCFQIFESEKTEVIVVSSTLIFALTVALGFLVYIYVRWRQDQEDEKVMNELRIIVNRAANKERYTIFLPDER